MSRTCALSVRPSRYCGRCGTNTQPLVKTGSVVKCASERSCRRRRTGK